MFASDITLNDGAADHTYSQISLENSKSVRANATRDPGTPETLVISHSVAGSGMKAIDRHLIRLNLVEEDTGSTDIATLTGSTYIVIEKPRRIITSDDISKQVIQLVAFLTSANLTKILNGEP
jgi:hypothetical protein